MTYNVFSGTLNPTHSLTHSLTHAWLKLNHSLQLSGSSDQSPQSLTPLQYLRVALTQCPPFWHWISSSLHAKQRQRYHSHSNSIMLCLCASRCCITSSLQAYYYSSYQQYGNEDIAHCSLWTKIILKQCMRT